MTLLEVDIKSSRSNFNTIHFEVLPEVRIFSNFAHYIDAIVSLPLMKLQYHCKMFIIILILIMFVVTILSEDALSLLANSIQILYFPKNNLLCSNTFQPPTLTMQNLLNFFI